MPAKGTAGHLEKGCLAWSPLPSRCGRGSAARPFYRGYTNPSLPPFLPHPPYMFSRSVACPLPSSGALAMTHLVGKYLETHMWCFVLSQTLAALVW